MGVPRMKLGLLGEQLSTYPMRTVAEVCFEGMLIQLIHENRRETGIFHAER
ncbi:hypothetical protein AGR13a_Lc90448 [Agrobacterium genomosp. 13 str. CFBP 6927]|uniref:Transposase n=1 Tax=Agrobacterium genomosp. 13 str. CFBP 6927 TaxID=1183428 RepID=A0ABM9VP28_9HYPH|nr:hypothetical protein AGR13a_Lc90448 [Agrobacterium genomosp. 13 str. CFBP 6927]